MTEQKYALYYILKHKGAPEPTRYDVIPIEGTVKESWLETSLDCGGNCRLHLTVTSDEKEEFTFHIPEAMYRVDVGEKVRLFPHNFYSENDRKRMFPHSVVALQVLALDGSERFRHTHAGYELRQESQKQEQPSIVILR
jgi:hypothetical protein